jgi:tetratricopeptide (TPR) repeat protein
LLLELKRVEFLFERSGAEEIVYVFRHALTQEVAYESLLTTRRLALHAAAGHALETLHADQLEDAYDHLAYHYARTDQAPKAVRYLTLVAEKAARDYAHTETVASLREALVHVAHLPEEGRDRCMLDLVIRQAESLYRLGHHREAVELLLYHRERLECLQDALVTSQYYTMLGRLYSFLGERDKASESFQSAVDATRQSHDAIARGRVLRSLALEETFAGHLQEAVAHSREIVALSEETEDQSLLSQAYFLLGWSAYFSGDFAQALAALGQSAAIATTVSNRLRQTNATAIRGWTLAAQGDWESGIAACQRALQDSPQAFSTALVLGMLGYAYLEQGNISKAIPVLEQAVEQAIQYRSQQVQSWFHAYLGEAYCLNGQMGKAQNLAQQGLKLAQDAEHPWGMAIAQRTRGRIVQTSGDFIEAEAHFQEALETFSTIQSCFELARTYLDLAALAYAQNNHDVATTHLNQAYAWFKKLQVPKWVEKTEQLARKYGVALAEVELEGLAEGDV